MDLSKKLIRLIHQYLFAPAFLVGSLFVARQSFALVTQQRRRTVLDLLERLSERASDEDESSDAN